MNIQLYKRRYKANDFDCGYLELNAYIKQYAATNTRDGYGRTFVMLEESAGRENHICGYYTMSTNSVPLALWPDDKKGPELVPSLLLGKLAVDKAQKGQRLGEFLLMHACHRAVTVADFVGVHVLEVQAIDEKARDFYLKYEFIPYQVDTMHLFLPISTLRQIDYGAFGIKANAAGVPGPADISAASADNQ